MGLNLRYLLLQDSARPPGTRLRDRSRRDLYSSTSGAAWRRPATGILPPVSWAFDAGVFHVHATIRRRRARCSTRPAIRDPDGDGPAPRLHLTLKMSNNEFNRLQSSVIQQNLRAIGIALDVRTYEFATLYADVLKGNFQLFTLQWVGGAVAHSDILRRVFHSQPGAAGRLQPGLLQGCACRSAARRGGGDDRRGRRGARSYADVQQIVAEEAPYISLWCKTNAAVAHRDLTGIHILPIADFTFLKDVARESPRDARRAGF